MPISRVEIIDHGEFGRLVAKWAMLDELLRPQSIADIKTAVDQNVCIPSRIKYVKWVQPNLETLLVHLPNKEMLVEAEQLFSGNSKLAYILPQFYTDKLVPAGSDVHISNEDLLYARIGDYSVGQCR